MGVRGSYVELIADSDLESLNTISLKSNSTSRPGNACRYRVCGSGALALGSGGVGGVFNPQAQLDAGTEAIG